MSFDAKQLVSESAGVFLANWQVGLAAGLLQLVPAVGGVAVVNWQEAVKRNAAQGEPVELATVLDLDNAFEKAQGSFALLVGAVICAAVARLLGTLGIFISIGGLVGVLLLAGLFAFSYAVMADKPGITFLRALRGTAAFARRTPVPLFQLTVLGGAIVLAGAIPLGLGLPVSLPIASGVFFLAYRRLRPEVEAAAAAAGVELQ
ncbi:MAG: hypothetical protein AB7N76_30550 [Planctomycetota bacterium]